MKKVLLVSMISGLMSLSAWATPEKPCDWTGLKMATPLERAGKELAEAVLPHSDQKLKVLGVPEIVDYSEDGHPMSSPEYLEFQFESNPGEEAVIFRLNTFTKLEQSGDMVTLTSTTHIPTGEKTSLVDLLFDWAVSETVEPPRKRYYSQRGSLQTYNMQTIETEVRYTMRRGKLIYFEAWQRDPNKFFKKTLAHVVFGSP